jgi:hypothetical protein
VAPIARTVDGHFALQRRLIGRGGARWSTVQVFALPQAGPVLECAALLGRLGEPIEWRIVTDDRFQSVLLRWNVSAGWTMIKRRADQS